MHCYTEFLNVRRFPVLSSASVSYCSSFSFPRRNTTDLQAHSFHTRPAKITLNRELLRKLSFLSAQQPTPPPRLRKRLISNNSILGLVLIQALRRTPVSCSFSCVAGLLLFIRRSRTRSSPLQYRSRATFCALPPHQRYSSPHPITSQLVSKV